LRTSEIFNPITKNKIIPCRGSACDLAGRKKPLGFPSGSKGKRIESP
jgi:hypothetical protein